MIKRIFWDIDETLIHSSNIPFENQEQNVIILNDEVISTIIRPVAIKVLQFSRNLVGAENVYILTASSKNYAEEINQQGNFGFNDDQILSREDMEKNYYHNGPYGMGHTSPHSELADKNNVLIDNLPSMYNTDKMSFIGINSSRYLQIRDYYGVNYNNEDEKFVSQVIDFLTFKKSE
jgi:hypothetical protein